MPEVSVVIPTCNRAESLHRALQSLLPPRHDDPAFEVIVADNGSTDGTAAVVAQAAANGAPVRLVVERRPGSPHARNAGVHAASAPVVAFMDDDQEAHPRWVATIHETFSTIPGIDFICGPVRARWNAPPPPWLDREIAGAVSLIERGVDPRPIDRAHWMCLPGGNFACRRSVFASLGGFAAYPRSADREFTVRLLLNGCVGLYVPGMVMWHHLEADRLTRAHFRRWHAVEGRMRAGYRFLELFDRDGRIRPPQAGGRRLAGVPLFIYRELLQESGRWAANLARGRAQAAFRHELRMRYLAGYIYGRIRPAQHHVTSRPAAA